MRGYVTLFTHRRASGKPVDNNNKPMREILEVETMSATERRKQTCRPTR